MKGWKTAVLFFELIVASSSVASFIDRHIAFFDDWPGASFTLVLVAFACVGLSAYDDAHEKGKKEAREEIRKRGGQW